MKLEGVIGVELNALWAILETLDYGETIMVLFGSSLFLAQS